MPSTSISHGNMYAHDAACASFLFVALCTPCPHSRLKNAGLAKATFAFGGATCIYLRRVCTVRCSCYFHVVDLLTIRTTSCCIQMLGYPDTASDSWMRRNVRFFS